MRHRPGYAAVQYGDLRGEAAADFFQDIGVSTDLGEMARDLGWKGEGRVVGIKLSVAERKYDKTTLHCFYLTLYITDEYDIDTLKRMIKESGGVLLVRSYRIRLVDILNVVKLFKRFEIGLFTKLIQPTEVEVIEEEDQEDEENEDEDGDWGEDNESEEAE